MKKYLIILSALAIAAAAAGCGKEVETEVPETSAEAQGDLITVTLSATRDDVRASLSGTQVLWAAGDEIAVHDGTAVRTFTLASGAGTKTATFTGSVDSGATTLNALFPASAASWNGSSFDYSIPDEQDATTQSIDPAALIATGTGTVAGGLTFSNAPALLRFSVAAGVTRVIFHTRAKEAIAGDSPALFVTLPGTAGTFEVAINPGTYDGLRAFITDGSGTFLKEGSTSLTLAANQGKPLGAVSSSTEVEAITTADELIAYLGGSPTLDGYVCKDLDLTSKTVTTCATYANNFDGQFHSISNWESDGVALFNTVNAAGQVNNLTLDASCNLSNTTYDGDFGFIVMLLKGAMTGCVNKADVSAGWADMTKQHVFGPIVGRSSSTTACMTDCINYGDVEIEFTSSAASKMSTQYFGGVVGMTGTATDALRLDGCRNEADHITVTMHNGNTSASYLRNIYLGGIVGATGLSEGDAENTTGYSQNYGTYTGCVNNADVTLTWEGGTGGYLKVGGIVGVAQAKLLDCINNGDVTLESSTERHTANCCVGGIAAVIGGPASPNAKDCANNGTVTFTGSYTNSGDTTPYASGNLGSYWTSGGGCFGVVGDNATLIDNCDCNAPVNLDITMSDAGGSGHCLGGIVGYSMCAIQNCDFNSPTPTSIMSSTAKNGWIGGIVGLNKGNVTNCTSNAPITCTRANRNVAKDKITRLGGIVGYQNVAGTISGCTNSGAISLTTGDECGHVHYAGIVGSTAGIVTVNNCTNSGDLSFDGGGETKGQLYMGGIGSYYIAKSSFTGCSSTGDITATNWNNTAYSYIGGICSQYSGGGNTISDCTHNADITVTTTSKVRVAGIAAANNGTFTGNVHSGDITTTGVSGGAAANASQVGGLAGYWGNGNIGNSATRSCSVSGTIVTKLDGSDSATGGVVGSCNVSSTWTDLTVNTQITTNGSEYAGALLGRFHSDGSQVVTLAGTCVYTGTTLNGVAISSGNILGYDFNTGTISGYSD